MQEFGSSLGKPSFRGGRRDGDGLFFVNLGVVPNARNMLGVLRMVLRDHAVWQEPSGRLLRVPAHGAWFDELYGNLCNSKTAFVLFELLAKCCQITTYEIEVASITCIKSTFVHSLSP